MSITEKEILPIIKYFETQIELSGRDTYFTKKESQYVLDLIKRDWKSQGKMRKPYQVRNEMNHQKKLLNHLRKNMPCHRMATVYETRIHFASWILGDSDAF
jgi:hypothetical protein